jgi:hypothetical protein
MRVLLVTVCGLYLSSCARVVAPAPPRTTIDSTLVVPVSTLNVPVYYLIADIEELANKKIGSEPKEARVKVNPKGDSLFLTITRYEPVTIKYDGKRSLTCRVPIDIKGFFRGKKLGITIKNKTPVHARLALTVTTKVWLDKTWNLKTATTLDGIEWIEEPKLNIAGVKVNLRPPMENALEKHKADIIAKLDGSVGGLVKLGPSIEKVWFDLQKPIAINRKVIPVWLKMEGKNMSGRLVQSSKDTIAAEISLETSIESVLDSASAVQRTPIPPFHRTDSLNPGVHAFVKATIPFEVINRVIGQVTDTMKLKYGRHSVRIKSSEVYGTQQGIAIGLSLAGDLRADIYLRGDIGFDSVENQLRITNFVFDINSEQSLVSAADWFTHETLIEKIQPYLTLPMNNTFRVVPTLMTNGIEKGKLGRKIDLTWSDFNVKIHRHLVTVRDIQVILQVDGRAEVKLEKGLLDKKKKPV